MPFLRIKGEAVFKPLPPKDDIRFRSKRKGFRFSFAEPSVLSEYSVVQASIPMRLHSECFFVFGRSGISR